MELKVEIPQKLMFLWHPAPYKVARGGRYSCKSWSFARVLLAQGVRFQLRIVCFREVQKSIEQSVYSLMRDQIELMGIGAHYIVLADRINGTNGTEIRFAGLSDLTADTIKSFEGMDIAWIEEGQTITNRSLKILIPTLRKETSELWVSYNPELETDPIHQFFTINPPPGCKNVEINWRDIPAEWFTAKANRDRLHCLATTPDEYDWIWEGKCKPAVEGAIYAREIRVAESQNRITMVPYNPTLKVHVVFDLGKGKSLFVGMVQKHMNAILCIDCIDGGHNNLNTLNAELRSRKYNWGRVWMPHDAFATRIDAPQSSAEIMKRLGWDVVPKGSFVELSVEDGIRNVRLKFGQIYMDKVKCDPWVQGLKRYRRHTHRPKGSVGEVMYGDPVHDDYSHKGDCMRYVCINADKFLNEDSGAIPQYGNVVPWRPLDKGVNY